MKRALILLAAPVTLACASAAQAVDVPGLVYVDRYTLPYSAGVNGTVFGNTLFAGISGMDYDPASGTYYALSDDRSQNAPPGGDPAARFYNISIAANQFGFLGPNPITVNSATALRQPDGSTFPAAGVDPESIRVRRTGSTTSLYWTSEGAVAASGNPPLQNPFVREMNPDGSFVREFANPSQFNPDAVMGQTRGIRNNLAYESLTFSLDGSRIYAANESSLFQDGPRATATSGSVNRIAEFDMATGQPLRQFAYTTDPIQAANPANANDNGLVELLAIDTDTFLAVERSFSLNEGNNIRIYKVSLAGATDVSGFDSLVGELFTPVSKELLLTLPQPALGGAFNPDNVESLTLGPVMADGAQSFFLVSDNNFSAGQATQFLMIAVPAPGTGVLFVIGAAMARRRRR